MSGLKKGFLKSRDGSFAPALAVAMVPLVAAVGMVSDYSRGTAERTSMQSALDAASLSIMTMSKDTAKADRQKALQAAYVLNGGNGTDYVYGGSGNDVLTGWMGTDHIYGENGDDTIFENDGYADVIDGGNDYDQLTRDTLDTATNIEVYH